MKRLIAMGMAFSLFAATLTGCSGSASEETQAETESTVSESAAETEDTEKETLDLEKLTFTYVTSSLNVPTIIEKDQGIFEKTLEIWELMLSMPRSHQVQTRPRHWHQEMFRCCTQSAVLLLFCQQPMEQISRC